MTIFCVRFIGQALIAQSLKALHTGIRYLADRGSNSTLSVNKDVRHRLFHGALVTTAVTSTIDFNILVSSRLTQAADTGKIYMNEA